MLDNPLLHTESHVSLALSQARAGRDREATRGGFSLLELLAVVTILGIVAALIVSRYGNHTDSARQKLNAHHKASVNTAVERYYMETGAWPSADINELANDTYFPDGVPVSPYDGVTPYTIDTNTHRVNNNFDP